jgi:hypothetical protein
MRTYSQKPMPKGSQVKQTNRLLSKIQAELTTRCFAEHLHKILSSKIDTLRYCSTILLTRPGGRSSGQKAQKGPQKKKVGRKNFWPNFWLNFTKKWQKRGRRKFSKEVPYF